MPYVERVTKAGNTIEIERYFTSRYKKKGINDISVTLCWDNLEALCQVCHNKEHHKQERHKRYRFDENGGILPPYQKNN